MANEPKEGKQTEKEIEDAKILSEPEIIDAHKDLDELSQEIKKTLGE